MERETCDPLQADNPVVLAYMTGGWGDRLLRLPTLRALDYLFSKRLLFVAERYSQDTVFCGIDPSRFYAIPEAWIVNGNVYFNVSDLSGRIKNAHLILSIMDDGRFATAELLAAVAPGRSIGFIPECKTCLVPNLKVHRVEYSFAIPKHLMPSLRVEDFARPTFSATHHKRAREIRNLVPRGSRALTIHADTSSNKMWPPEHFVALLDAFLERHSNYFAVVIGMQNLHLDKGRLGGRVVPMLGLPLATTMALIGETDVFVGVDSCFLHAADLFGIPSVGLFGPTPPTLFGFRFSVHRHVCTRNELDGMKTISVNQVIEALESLICECNLG